MFFSVQSVSVLPRSGQCMYERPLTCTWEGHVYCSTPSKRLLTLLTFSSQALGAILGLHLASPGPRVVTHRHRWGKIQSRSSSCAFRIHRVCPPMTVVYRLLQRRVFQSRLRQPCRARISPSNSLSWSVSGLESFALRSSLGEDLYLNERSMGTLRPSAVEDS